MSAARALKTRRQRLTTSLMPHPHNNSHARTQERVHHGRQQVVLDQVPIVEFVLRQGDVKSGT